VRLNASPNPYELEKLSSRVGNICAIGQRGHMRGERVVEGQLDNTTVAIHEVGSTVSDVDPN